MELNKFSELPTDNLYKFTALFGILVFVLGLSFFYLGFHFADLKVNMQIKILNSKFAIQNDFKYIDLEAAIYEYNLKKILDKKESINNLSLKKFNDLINDQKKLIDQSSLTDFYSSKLLTYKIAIWITNILATILVGTGINLIKSGFENWYHRTQKYLDIILRQEAKKFFKKEN